MGEVDEVKREKDAFFARLALDVRERAERDADLIVLGHRGHFLRDHLLGSTADRVAEHAECPVLIVK